MAELDDKLLKNLDKTLESMNERLLTLETTLSGVKNGLNKTFDPSIITSFSDALRGIKTLRLIDAEKASQDINKVKDTLAKLQDAYQKWEGGELALSPKALSNLTDLLAKYKELNKNIDKGSEQRTVELANAAKKEADAVLAEERRKQREFQATANEQAKLQKAYSDIEQARSVVTGGKKFGELDAEQTKKYKEFGRTLDELKKKMDDLEKTSPGSKAAGTQIFKEQEAITKAKREAAEEQTRIKKEQAEQERQINEAIKEEERRRAAESKRMLDEEKKALADYIRLYSEKMGLLKTVAPIDAKFVATGGDLSEQEKNTMGASWKRIEEINAEMDKLRSNYVSVLEYEEKIKANGQEQVAWGKVRLTQEQALAKEKERQAKSESKQQSDEAKIQRQADAIVKKRIDLERQVQRIDNDRAIRQQTNSKISQQALDAESRKYEALLQRINQLNNALSKLEGKQSGVTARAEQRNQPYMNYVAAAEEERKAKAIENSNKKLKEQKKSLDSMLPTLQRLASAFGVAFSVRGLAQFGKKLIETRGEFELQQVALRSILQNKQLADEIWDKTMQQALQSPFKAMQLVDYTKKLAAYRVETEKLFDTTKRLADVSAGLGVDMGRLILAYGQVKTANYLRASEVRQFTEAGVNIYGELAKYFSELEGHAVSTAEVVERVTKRMVLFSDVEKIFQRMTDEGGVFFNMQEVQADTVRGQIQKLHDAYDQMLNTIGQANQGTIRDLVDKLNDLVRNWRTVASFMMKNVNALVILLPLIKSYQKGAELAAGKSYTWGMVMNRAKAALTGLKGSLTGATAGMTKYRLSVIAGTSAMRLFSGAINIAKTALRTFVPILAIEGLLWLITKMQEASKAAEQLQKSIDEIKGKNSQSLQENIEGFNKLKAAIEQTNDGSLERQRLIEKMNNTYGDYLPNLITEVDTIKQLDDAYEGVIQNMREYEYQKTKEEISEKLRASMFDDYTNAVRNLTKGAGATINYGAQGAKAFKLSKSEIQDILKLIQDEVMKNPNFNDINATNIANQVIRNYTGLNDAIVSNEKYWRQYVIDIRDQVKELKDLDEYARDVIHESYTSIKDRDAANALREKAKQELEAENEAWAKEKESLRTTIEESVLQGIMEARQKASKVTRQEGESDDDFARRAWDAQVKADEEAQKQIRQQHTITNFAIEQKEKEHQAKLLKIRLDNQQISAREYNKQMLAIYPELDDRIKQYNDKIRDMVVGQFGEDWKGNADAIAMFKKMRIGIDDVSQGVAQYQKNFAGTVENQKKIVEDLYGWIDMGYEIDQKDLEIQKEKLAVYYEMAHLLGVEVKDKVIGDALFDALQSEIKEKYGRGFSETDRLMSQMELLDKYTKKWEESGTELETLMRSLDKLKEEGVDEESIQKLQGLIDEATANYGFYQYMKDLLGSGKKNKEPINAELFNEIQDKLASAFPDFKMEETDKLMSQMELLDKYTKKWQDLTTKLNSLTQSKKEMEEAGASQKTLDLLQSQIDDTKTQVDAAGLLKDLLGYIAKAISGGRQENASKLISLIKEMRSEYDKLSKSAYGYAKSEKKVRESYKDSVKEILGKAGITDYDFTTNEGMIKALEKVKSYATNLGKDAAAEVQKYIDQLETEIEINAQVRIREDFARQMEKAFNDYELTLELEKLNIPADAMKDLFPTFNQQTLGQMQDIMKAFYEEKEEEDIAFDEEDLKEFKKWADKVDAEILKSRKERAKEYSKFLEKEYSERAKVEMQYAKDVAFVTANFSGQQQKNILEGINDKFQKDISELNWKSFKESSFYVEMMDDLSSVPIEYMKLMLSKIEEILQNPEALPPRALKEAINARQKIIEAQMDFDQIAVMRDSMKEIRAAAQAPNEDGTGGVGGKNWRQTKKNLDEELKLQAEKLAGIEEEIRANEKLQGQLKGLEDRQKAYNDARKNLSSETISDLGELNDPQSLMNEYEADIAVWKKQLDDLKKAEGEATPEMNDKIAKLEERIRLRQIEIGLLEKYKEALRGLGAYESTEEGQVAVQAQGAGQTSTSVGGKITKGKNDAENVSKRLTVLQKWQKAFKNFNDSFSKFNKNAADMVNRLGALSNAAFDLYEALGGETDAMTEAWKEFGGTIVNTITQALAMIPTLVAGFVTAGTTINAAMGIIGLIAEAIQLVLVLITGLAKLNDASVDKQIEDSKKKVDALQKAYDRLEKSIEKTFDTVSYMRVYNQEVQNLYEQIEHANQQIAAAQDYKNKKKKEETIEAAEEAKQQALDSLEEIKQKQIDVFNGIGKEGYRDAAQEFVDAWKSAFLETGDGLQGLQEHFDEFLNDWFVKQATMRIAANNLAPLFQKIDQAVGQYGDGGANVTWRELQEINDLKDLLLEQTNEQLKELAGVFGLGGEGSLSGLASGIQGMTEEQASILEAYWNSVRGYTASIDANVATIVGLLSEGGISGGVNYNPMLAQMTLVAQNTNNINTLLQSVTKSGHSQGGYGIKVFAD